MKLWRRQNRSTVPKELQPYYSGTNEQSFWRRRQSVLLSILGFLIVVAVVLLIVRPGSPTRSTHNGQTNHHRTGSSIATNSSGAQKSSTPPRPTGNDQGTTTSAVPSNGTNQIADTGPGGSELALFLVGALAGVLLYQVIIRKKVSPRPPKF